MIVTDVEQKTGAAFRKIVIENGDVIAEVSLSNDTDRKNLQLVDSQMCQIMEVFADICQNKQLEKVSEIVSDLERSDPLDIKIPGFYGMKIKTMLINSVLSSERTGSWADVMPGPFVYLMDEGVFFRIYSLYMYDELGEDLFNGSVCEIIDGCSDENAKMNIKMKIVRHKKVQSM